MTALKIIRMVTVPSKRRRKENTIYVDISVRYTQQKRTVSSMKKKKLNGWVVIGICIAAMALAAGAIIALGQLG